MIGQLSLLFRYIGGTTFAPGEWAGVELDQPKGMSRQFIFSCNLGT